MLIMVLFLRDGFVLVVWIVSRIIGLLIVSQSMTVRVVAGFVSIV